MGIVADVHNQGLDREPRKQVYLPLRQSPTAGMAVVARTNQDPAAMANTIQRVIWDVDPGQPIYELSTMDQILARAVFLPRLSTTLLATFALAALLLAALGIYGVLSYSVSQRTREIGLRMALGASGGNTVAMIVRNSVIMVAIGGVDRPHCRDAAGAVDGRHPVRRRAVRRAVVHDGGDHAADCGRAGEPVAGAADDTGRSRRRATRPVARWNAPQASRSPASVSRSPPAKTAPSA